MKELTIEQKAEAYDKALKRAREALNDGTINGDVIACIQDIFPEIVANEDERIRKEIICFIKDISKAGHLHAKHSVEWLAWLEKQDEQKSKFRVGDTIKNKYDDRQFTIKSVDLDRGTYTYTQEGCGNDIDYADEEFELVEQKPVAWSEEDEKAVNDIMWIIEAYRKNGFNETHIQITDSSENWLKSLKEKYTWKPSEEQMKALNYVVNLMASSESPKENDYYYNVFKDLRKQLKKLREE